MTIKDAWGSNAGNKRSQRFGRPQLLQGNPTPPDSASPKLGDDQGVRKTGEAQATCTDTAPEPGVLDAATLGSRPSWQAQIFGNGAPRHGQPQDWRHRAMRKGFVSERELNVRARDLRICMPT
jgi:hypothetical protein